MKQRLLIIILAFSSACIINAQEKYTPSYSDLKKYEGKYEYVAGSTLEIAASPKDLILFAIVDDARYALTPVQKDVFLNPGKQAVIFTRNSSGKITGYTVNDEHPDKHYLFLDANVHFPEAMWYARKKIEPYRYIQPTQGTDGLLTGPLQGTGLDTAALARMTEKIADGSLPNVHSVLIIKNNKLVFEEYFYEYGAAVNQQIRSATKSFISSLVGIAIERGFIKSKDQTVLSFFPEYSLANMSEDKKKITIENMLNNQSGLACNDHDDKSPGNENKMYPTADWVKFILDLPMAFAPGTEARYCSGNVMTLARIIEKATGQSLYHFAKENLFDKIGAAGYRWAFQPDSSQMNSFGQLYIRPRDMAKFGSLFLHGGKWNGQQVIPEAWVRASLEPHTTVDNTPYGYLWWHPWLTVNGKRNDATAAKGNGGQRIYLRPDLDMVVVITGGNYNSESSADRLLAQYILPAFNRN